MISETLKSKFESCESAERRYELIINLGKEISPYPEEKKLPENLVRGCQSQMYLYSIEKEGKLFFSAWSDALISKGLAALLIDAYSGCSAEEVLTKKPFFLQELGILESLTPSRSNGVQALYLKMQQQALAHLTSRQTEA